MKTWIKGDVEKKRYAGFGKTWREFALALVKDNTNSKVKLVVKEMNSKQARSFSQLDMGWKSDRGMISF